MTLDFFQENWALFVAAAISVAVTAVILQRVYEQSSSGQLRVRVRAHKGAKNRQSTAERNVERRRQKLQSLADRAARVRPADLDAAKGALGDAEALLKIANDKVLVEANLLRKLIFEQFPPQRHDALRARYLPDDIADGRPFSF